MKNKVHTFVICAYGESPYLEECINSVISQKDYSEVILATSTPNIYIDSLCKKYDIKQYVNKGETGITQDWTFAISCCNTELVTIAPQDDVYFQDYSKMVVERYQESKKPLIIFSDYWELRNGEYTKNNKLLNIKRLMLLPLRISIMQRFIFVRRLILSFGSPICCPSVAYTIGNLPKPLFWITSERMKIGRHGIVSREARVSLYI